MKHNLPIILIGEQQRKDIGKILEEMNNKPLIFGYYKNQPMYGYVDSHIADIIKGLE